MNEQKALEAFIAAGGDVDKTDIKALEYIVNNMPELLDGSSASSVAQQPEKSLTDKAIDTGLTALNYGLRGLDYAGGLARTGVYGAADELAQALGVYEDDRINTEEDLYKALKGKAPTSADQLERMGVDKMGTVTLPVLGEVSARGAAGLASDILLDPLTYATLGASAASKVAKGGSALQKAARPTAKIQSSLGKKLFRSGLKDADAAAKAAKKGVNAASDTLLKHGVSGSAQGIVTKVDDLTNVLNATKDDIIRESTELGAKVNVRGPLEDLASDLNKVIEGKNIPTVKNQAATLKNEIDEILKFSDDLSVAEADAIKTQLYNTMKSDAYRELAKTSYGTRARTKASKLFKEGIEDAVETTTGKGKLLAETNKDLGNLLSAKKGFARAAKKAENVNKITAVDAMLAGAGGIAGGGVGFAPLLLKKAADVSKGARFRTGVGKAMYYDPGVTDALLRRSGTLMRDEE